MPWLLFFAHTVNDRTASRTMYQRTTGAKLECISSINWFANFVFRYQIIVELPLKGIHETMLLTPEKLCGEVRGVPIFGVG